MNVLTIAYLTFLEARHRKLLWAVVIMGAAFLTLFTIGFFFAHREFSRGRDPMGEILEANNFFLLAGLYAVNFLIVMLTVLTSVDTLAGEISSGIIHTVVTKNLRRWEIVAGNTLLVEG